MEWFNGLQPPCCRLRDAFLFFHVESCWKWRLWNDSLHIYRVEYSELPYGPYISDTWALHNDPQHHQKKHLVGDFWASNLHLFDCLVVVACRGTGCNPSEPMEVSIGQIMALTTINGSIVHTCLSWKIWKIWDGKSTIILQDHDATNQCISVYIERPSKEWANVNENPAKTKRVRSLLVPILIPGIEHGSPMFTNHGHHGVCTCAYKSNSSTYYREKWRVKETQIKVT